MWSKVESKHQAKRTGLHDWAEEASVTAVVSRWGKYAYEKVNLRTAPTAGYSGGVCMPLWLDITESFSRCNEKLPPLKWKGAMPWSAGMRFGLPLSKSD